LSRDWSSGARVASYTKDGVQTGNMLPYFNAFDFLFIIIASLIPTSMASYNFVGEKVEKSLEPLLATPVTDNEILLGKSIASFLPSMAATFLGGVIYMILIDIITQHQLGYLYYPTGPLLFSFFWLHRWHAFSVLSSA